MGSWRPPPNRAGASPTGLGTAGEDEKEEMLACLSNPLFPRWRLRGWRGSCRRGRGKRRRVREGTGQRGAGLGSDFSQTWIEKRTELSPHRLASELMELPAQFSTIPVLLSDLNLSPIPKNPQRQGKPL